MPAFCNNPLTKLPCAGKRLHAERPRLVQIFLIAFQCALRDVQLLQRMTKRYIHQGANVFQGHVASLVQQRLPQRLCHQRIGIEQRAVKIPDQFHRFPPCTALSAMLSLF